MESGRSPGARHQRATSIGATISGGANGIGLSAEALLRELEELKEAHSTLREENHQLLKQLAKLPEPAGSAAVYQRTVSSPSASSALHVSASICATSASQSADHSGDGAYSGADPGETDAE